MPLRNRLLALIVMAIFCSLSMTSIARQDNLTPAQLQKATATNNESLPFDNQSVPSATAIEPEPTPTAPAAAILESKPAKSHKGGNNSCASADSNSLQKSLLVMAFPRQSPSSSNAGALSEAEHQLPALLSEQLFNRHNTLAPIQMSEALPVATISTEHLLAQQIQTLARTQRTQLVLSGEIIDMSMSHPEAVYDPNLYTRFLNGLFDFIETKNRFDKRDRLFSFQLHLRDGYTGQELFNERYNTYGIWNQDKDVGFGSPLFWNTDYGQQIKGLVKKAAKDVGEVIQCQPYIAQIDSRPGQTQIILQGGANNGLRAGDTLALYQLLVQGSETQYAQHQVRLVNRNAEIQLREVYPSHSVGVVSGTTYLTGQFLAVSP